MNTDNKQTDKKVQTEKATPKKATSKKATPKKTSTKKASKPKTATASTKKAAPKKAAASTKKENVKEKVVNEPKNEVQQAKEVTFMDEARENVIEGAKVVGEEAKNWGSKISAYSEVLFGKVKKTTSKALKYGQELTEEAVNKAQEIGENLRDNYQVNQLNGEKKKIASQLGMKMYLEIKNNKNKIPVKLLDTNEEIVSLIKQLEEIDKKILDYSEKTNK
ncbi:MAG: hypothetical protein K9H26_17890 [Prolixibacteraceae bacterium]|nr:hypothetical protein [Prolixibacteraceae bacterium]